MKLVKKKYVGLHQILVITLVKSRLWEVHSLHERHRLVCNDSRTNRRVASVVKKTVPNKNMPIGLWWEIRERLIVVKIKAFCLLFV